MTNTLRDFFAKAVKVGEYNLLMTHGQMSVYLGEELVKAFDIKNISEDKAEFAAFVERFKESYAAREKRKAEKK